MDTVQTDYRCCGDRSYTDWFVRAWLDPGHLSVVVPGEKKKFLQEDGRYHSDDTPYSCCDPRAPRPCVHHHVHSSKLHKSYQPLEETTLYVQGCRQALARVYGNVLLTVALIALLIATVKTSVLLLVRLVQTSLTHARTDGEWAAASDAYIYYVTPQDDDDTADSDAGGDNSASAGEGTATDGEVTTSAEQEEEGESGESEESGSSHVGDSSSNKIMPGTSSSLRVSKRQGRHTDTERGTVEEADTDTGSDDSSSSRSKGRSGRKKSIARRKSRGYLLSESVLSTRHDSNHNHNVSAKNNNAYPRLLYPPDSSPNLGSKNSPIYKSGGGGFLRGAVSVLRTATDALNVRGFKRQRYKGSLGASYKYRPLQAGGESDGDDAHDVCFVPDVRSDEERVNKESNLQGLNGRQTTLRQVNAGTTTFSSRNIDFADEAASQRYKTHSAEIRNLDSTPKNISKDNTCRISLDQGHNFVNDLIEIQENTPSFCSRQERPKIARTNLTVSADSPHWRGYTWTQESPATSCPVPVLPETPGEEHTYSPVYLTKDEKSLLHSFNKRKQHSAEKSSDISKISRMGPPTFLSLTSQCTGSYGQTLSPFSSPKCPTGFRRPPQNERNSSLRQAPTGTANESDVSSEYSEPELEGHCFSTLNKPSTFNSDFSGPVQYKEHSRYQHRKEANTTTDSSEAVSLEVIHKKPPWSVNRRLESQSLYRQDSALWKQEPTINTNANNVRSLTELRKGSHRHTLDSEVKENNDSLTPHRQTQRTKPHLPRALTYPETASNIPEMRAIERDNSLSLQTSPYKNVTVDGKQGRSSQHCDLESKEHETFQRSGVDNKRRGGNEVVSDISPLRDPLNVTTFLVASEAMRSRSVPLTQQCLGRQSDTAKSVFGGPACRNSPHVLRRSPATYSRSLDSNPGEERSPKSRLLSRRGEDSGSGRDTSSYIPSCYRREQRASQGSSPKHPRASPLLEPTCSETKSYFAYL
ncbi:uncharacterized protein LOC101854518 [Aplysia californica]|uniref:Uncharacterized protein LOC101854518 n=1 Tax=Aplysia californica TaxID=6500 RepID=A0ABM0K069_APLCA|nr:uncharacterized protein LOC101854518 [Aplysia californica]